MNIAQTGDPGRQTALRVWPGVAIVLFQWFLYLVLPSVAPGFEIFGVSLGIVSVIGAVACGAVLLLWWLFFSRAYWSERLGAVALMAGALLATKVVVHESIAGAGQGMLLYFASIPGLCLALVIWAVVARRFSHTMRRLSLVAAILIAFAPWALVRTAGITSDGSEYHWRWTPTPEQRLLAEAKEETFTAAPKPLEVSTETPPVSALPTTAANVSPAPSSAVKAEAVATETAPATKVDIAPASSESVIPRVEWPGFRGPNRDGVIRGVQISTDWSTSPPASVWRRPIGPGWSSFAVEGDLLYTQEQRGDDEIVACYRVSTGEPVWRHRNSARFWESNGGAGPRGTPTVSQGRVYALGATGILNALNAATGAVVWTRNAATDTGVEVPGWGFASSPLVVNDVVIVAVSGQLAGYDMRTGEPRWQGPKGGAGYSSPHLVTLDGVPQVLLLRGSRTISVAPADGTLLWEHVWQVGVGIVQPAVAPNGDLLITTGDAMGGLGIRRVSVKRSDVGWKVEERWTSRGLKPYFNDFVVHKGHAFGFDGSILACINLEDGARAWKGGRYGNGQLVLLPDQDWLLVMSEDGELALVNATPDKFTELAKIPALDGKTWNHPVLIGTLLLARNGQEMAAFRLTAAGK